MPVFFALFACHDNRTKSDKNQVFYKDFSQKEKPALPVLRVVVILSKLTCAIRSDNFCLAVFAIT